MELRLDDDGFVRAPAWLVYRYLVDLDGYAAWWPWIKVRPAGDEGAVRVSIRRRRFGRRVRFVARPHGFRQDAGLYVSLTGGLAGEAEWWLEERSGGTVVHHLLHGVEVVRGRPRRVLATYRGALRQGLWGLKDAVQSEVRRRIGLPP